ncbi:MAG: hypothetical protein KIT09_22695 [Bryobacteraceae bacterium]|nr:hypothetical protein [Bryobacteraceae bacterium]
MRTALSVFLLLVSTAALRGQSEFLLHYQALERILANQAFTRQGRLYLRGDPDARCSYAYLQSPKVSSESGKLRIRAAFSGRSALDLFGRCVGVGDSFDLVLLAIPYVRDGSLRLREVSVACEADGMYPRAVCLSIARSLERDFRHDLRATAERMLGQDCSVPMPLFQRELERFEVTDIRIHPEGVVLALRFRLALK